MYQGDTVRLKVNFKTFTGQGVNPVNPMLTIYNNKKEQIEQFILDDTNNESLGVYFYDYIPASELNEFIFEFAGSYNSKPIISRGRIEVKFT